MKKILSTAIIVLVIIAVAFALPKENHTENIKIGVSDDTSGFVIDYMTTDKDNKSNAEEIEAYFIQDC